jgi:hypothetical protein
MFELLSRVFVCLLVIAYLAVLILVAWWPESFRYGHAIRNSPSQQAAHLSRLGGLSLRHPKASHSGPTLPSTTRC